MGIEQQANTWDTFIDRINQLIYEKAEEEGFTGHENDMFFAEFNIMDKYLEKGSLCKTCKAGK